MGDKLIYLSGRKSFEKATSDCQINKFANGFKLLSKEEKETLLVLLEAFLIDKIR